MSQTQCGNHVEISFLSTEPRSEVGATRLSLFVSLVEVAIQGAEMDKKEKTQRIHRSKYHGSTSFVGVVNAEGRVTER